MRVVLHGYVYCSNFGDMLFADLFYNKCKELGFEVDFISGKYGITKEVRDEIGYYREKSIKELLDYDCLILYSGGFLGERDDDTPYLRYKRYIEPIELFASHNKKVYILGAGCTKIDNEWLKEKTINALKRVTKIIVREPESKEVLVKYGLDPNNIISTSDTALVIESNGYIKHNNIFLHLPYNELTVNSYNDIVIPSLHEFINKHSEYKLYIGSDYLINGNIQVLNKIKSEGFIYHNYTNYKELISFLDTMDIIITPKLHVGIIGTVLNKSVIAISDMYIKTHRYYDQIGYSDRCTELKNLSRPKFDEMLNSFYDKNITIPKDITELAKLNICELNNIK